MVGIKNRKHDTVNESHFVKRVETLPGDLAFPIEILRHEAPVSNESAFRSGLKKVKLIFPMMLRFIWKRSLVSFWRQVAEVPVCSTTTCLFAMLLRTLFRVDNN